MMYLSLVLVVIYLSSVLGLPSMASLEGDYFVDFHSVDSRTDMSREYADWNMKIGRISKNQTSVVGWFKVKERIHRPEIRFVTYVWMQNGYSKMALEEFSTLSLCDEDIKDNFYYPVFEGNVTWSKGPNCSISPGFERFKKGKAFEVDALAHKKLDKLFYGRFKIVATVFDQDNHEVGGVIAEVNVSKPKTKTQTPMVPQMKVTGSKPSFG